MSRKEYNLLILELVKTYLDINPDMRLNQALNNLGIYTYLYYEEPEKTYLKVKANFDQQMKGISNAN